MLLSLLQSPVAHRESEALAGKASCRGSGQQAGQGRCGRARSGPHLWRALRMRAYVRAPRGCLAEGQTGTRLSACSAGQATQTLRDTFS